MTEMHGIWHTWTLSDGPLDLVLLPGIGGRLWDIRFHGKSLLFQNPDLAGHDFELGSLAELPTRSPLFGFPLWGGEKTWIAPDTDWPGGAPQPVLDSGPFRVVSSSDRVLRMESEICPDTGLVVDREVALRSASHWTITHKVLNKGDGSRRCGIWSVMMLTHPASIGVTGDRLEVQAVFDDHNGRATQGAAGVIVACDETAQFKVAFDNPCGSSLIRATADPVWLLCRTHPREQGDTFAHGQPFEVFNSGDYPYCEAEWHSPQATLAPGESLSFQQTFHIWRSEEPTSTTLTEPERKLMQCMS